MTLLQSTATLLIVASALSNPGCEPADPTSSPTREGSPMPSEQLQVTPLYSSTNSGFSGPAELVIRDRSALDRAMQEATHDVVADPTALEVDFGTDMVVLVAIGTRSSGGYGVRVEEVVRSDGGAVVHYTVTRPGTGCMTTQALTSPVEVVRVERIEGSVTFERRDVAQDC